MAIHVWGAIDNYDLHKKRIGSYGIELLLELLISITDCIKRSTYGLVHLST